MLAYCQATTTVSSLLVSLHVYPLGGSKDDRQDILCALNCYLLLWQLSTVYMELYSFVLCTVHKWSFVHPTILLCIVYNGTFHPVCSVYLLHSTQSVVCSQQPILCALFCTVLNST